mmetsp:Transcript_10297/g.38185  ORF Transcript_10297/g.38185 Transcript_10297/m.38185 type:complete len:286 (+) Transcript_10297:119-976(+)
MGVMYCRSMKWKDSRTSIELKSNPLPLPEPSSGSSFDPNAAGESIRRPAPRFKLAVALGSCTVLGSTDDPPEARSGNPLLPLNALSLVSKTLHSMFSRFSAGTVAPPTTSTVNRTAPSVDVNIARPSSPRFAAASIASAKAMAPRKPENQSILAWLSGIGAPPPKNDAPVFRKTALPKLKVFLATCETTLRAAPALLFPASPKPPPESDTAPSLPNSEDESPFPVSAPPNFPELLNPPAFRLRACRLIKPTPGNTTNARDAKHITTVHAAVGKNRFCARKTEAPQ